MTPNIKKNTLPVGVQTHRLNNNDANEVSAASQDYLEVIYELSLANEKIRSIDIAEKLEVSKASVNKAVNVLKAAGLITQEKYYDIQLTVAGQAAALEVIERHRVLKYFLIEILGVAEHTAEADACMMEHSVSSETLEKLKIFLEQQT